MPRRIKSRTEAVKHLSRSLHTWKMLKIILSKLKFINLRNQWYHTTVMRSRDPFLPVSVSVLVSKVSGLVSVSKVSGLETLNTVKKWFIKICIIQRFLFVVFVGKKQPKHVGKMPEVWKKFKSEVMTTFFLNFGKTHKFWSLESRSQTSIVGVFDEVSVSSRNFNQVSVSV